MYIRIVYSLGQFPEKSDKHVFYIHIKKTAAVTVLDKEHTGLRPIYYTFNCINSIDITH
jgi:hypothetical protein